MALDSKDAPASPPAGRPAARSPRRKSYDPLWLALVGSAGLLVVALLAASVWLVNSLKTPARPTAAAPTDTRPLGFVVTRTAGPAVPLTAPVTAAPPAAPPAAQVVPIEAAAATPASLAQVEPPALPLAAALSATLPATPTLPLTATATAAGAAPQSYAVIGRIVLPPSELGRGVAVNANYGYALARSGRLYVYDLTGLDPSQELQTYARPIQTLQLKNGGGLLRFENTLYAYGPSGIEILDLSRPDQPLLLSQLKDLQATSLLIANQRLYALGQGIIIVYDITQPLHPSWVQKLHQPVEVNNFSGAIRQGMLYVSEYWFNGVKTRSLLRIYRLSLTGEIKEVQRIDAGELAYQMDVQEDKLIRCTSTDVEVWDLSQIDYPHFQEASPGPARACAFDQGNILAHGAIFSLQKGRLTPLPPFDPDAGLTGAPRPFEASPYGAAAANGYVFLAQPDQILILAGR